MQTTLDITLLMSRVSGVSIPEGRVLDSALSQLRIAARQAPRECTRSLRLPIHRITTEIAVEHQRVSLAVAAHRTLIGRLWLMYGAPLTMNDRNTYDSFSKYWLAF
jgi:hypothetical protein